METGIEPILRPIPSSEDSGLWALLLGAVIVGLFCFPVFRRLINEFLKQLFRHRGNVLGVETTLGERLVVAASVCQLLIFEALALYSMTGAGARPPLAAVGGLILLAAVVFFVQLIGYKAVGYAFSSSEETDSWLRAFLLTQGLAGYMVVIPVLGAFIYPEWMTAFILVSAVIFVWCRILLYIREFGIFHTNAASIIYFFLYLCTLEIVPLLLVWAVTPTFLTLFC